MTKVINRVWVGLIMYLRGFIYGAAFVGLLIMGMFKQAMGFYVAACLMTSVWIYLFYQMDKKAKVHK